MSESEHGLTAEDIEELQRITDERQKFVGERRDLRAKPENREEAFRGLERLTDDRGLSWVTANRVSKDTDLSSGTAGIALGDLHRLDLADRRGERSPFQYRIAEGV